MSDKILEWVKVVGPIIISWPIVALIFILLFKVPLLRLLKRFSESEGSTAEIGPIKIALGNPLSQQQYGEPDIKLEFEQIDLSEFIGSIRDTGQVGAIVGFAVAYALQAVIKIKTDDDVVLSARGIYTIAKKYDEWPGEDHEGTSISGALNGLTEEGAYLESDWPFPSKTRPMKTIKPAYKISGFAEIKGIEQILDSLRSNNVVIVSISISNDFFKPSDKGRVVIKLPFEPVGATAICIVGYDGETAEFTFANAWGLRWGANGFGRIRDTDLSKTLKSAYILEL